MTIENAELALKYAHRDVGLLAEVIRLCPNRGTCVQAGGGMGVYPAALSAAFGNVYTFEPDAEQFAELCRNAPQLNVHKFQAAVGFYRGLVSISRDRREGSGPRHPGLAHVVRSVSRGSVPVLRIDDLQLPECGLIALDVEGMELEALDGAVSTIVRCRPALLIEMNKNTRDHAQVRRTIEELCQVRHSGRYGSDDFFLPAEVAHAG